VSLPILCQRIKQNLDLAQKKAPTSNIGTCDVIGL